MDLNSKGFLFFLKTGALIAAVIFISQYLIEMPAKKITNENIKQSKNIDEKIEILKLGRLKKIFVNDETENNNSFRKIKSYEDFYSLIGVYDRAIGADLQEMKIILYENGGPLKEFSIVSKGKPGSSWETPTGEYKVNFKEEKHFSSIGKVWMPYSIQFYGNFFIHGWPYYPDSAPVREGYSGGCIRLKTKDAREVFEFAKKSTPIIVYDGKNGSFADNLNFKLKKIPEPEINAKSFLVADLSSGSVFLERESETKRPIASITKLMTAVVASEAIFIERTVKINEQMLETYGDSGHLNLGEELSLNDLFYPLLMESSNDAAKAISLISMGEKSFISLMNDKSAALGMKNTKFSDTSGISSENLSTAEDLFLLSKYMAGKRSFLLKITAEPFKKIVSKNSEFEHTFHNFNHFAGNSEFTGGKTGYTKDANGTMASIFKLPINGEIIPISIIVLNSDDREKDTKNLISWLKEATKKTDSNEIKLGFTGDIMLNRGVEKFINSYGNGDYNFPFLNVHEKLQKYDLLFGNLEGPISNKGENVGSIYSFRMNPKAAEAIKYAGFDAVSVANNHIGDWGIKALSDTLTRLKNSGIIYVGGGFNKKEAYSPKIIEIKGMKIAFLGFSEFGKNYLEAYEDTPGIAFAYEEEIAKNIYKARKSADIVIATFHFGTEYQKKPNDYQIKLSKIAADAGADLIIGHHPHVIQPVEKYNNSYIAYSLGNFVFDQNFSKDTMEGLLFEVEIDPKTKKISNTNQIKVKINSKFQPYFE